MIEIYLLPDKVEEFKKAFKRLTKKLSDPPTYEIGEAKNVLTTKTFDGKTSKTFVLLHLVTISNLDMDGWDCVATIYHFENVTKINHAELFKYIPKKFGFNYIHCDHCGRDERRRKISHIIHRDGEWKQVGSSCIDKLFNQGRYLSRYATEIHQLIKRCGCTCDEIEDFCCYKIPTHYHLNATPIRLALSCVADYRKDNPTWIKTTYEGMRKIEGTNYDLQKHLATHFDDFDRFNEVKTLVEQLCWSDFNRKIKEAFECEFIPQCDMWIAFFAHKMWEDSLNPFADICESKGIKKGVEIELCGKIISVVKEKDPYNYFNPITFIYTIKGDDGLTYIKESNSSTLFDKYTDAEGNIKCRANVGWISLNKNTITLKGRLKKI